MAEDSTVDALNVEISPPSENDQGIESEAVSTVYDDNASTLEVGDNESHAFSDGAESTPIPESPQSSGYQYPTYEERLIRPVDDAPLKGCWHAFTRCIGGNQSLNNKTKLNDSS